MLKYILVCAIGMIVGSLIRGAIEKQRDWMLITFSTKNITKYCFDLSGLHTYKNVYFAPVNKHEAIIVAKDDTEEIYTLDFVKEITNKMENNDDR